MNAKFLNKGVSTSVALLIIAICAIFVGGILFWQLGGITKESKLPEIKAPATKAPEEIVSGEETANWKTYRNEEYGFEIKYPKDWAAKEWPEVNVPRICSTQFPEVGIEIVEIELPGLPSTKFLEQAKPRIGIIPQSEKNIEINRLKARQWDTDFPSIVTFVEKDTESVFQIEFYYHGHVDLRNIHNQILSTFRVIK